MPSSLSIYSLAPKTKVIFQFLRGILEGPPSRARPFQPILKNCRNGTFLPVDEIWNFWGTNDFIWSAMKVPFCDFIQNLPQAPSICISMWIKVNKWNYLKNPSQESKNYFCFRFLWISKKTGRQTWNNIFNFLKNKNKFWKKQKYILFSGPMYSYFQWTQFLLQFLHFAIKTAQRNPKEKE